MLHPEVTAEIHAEASVSYDLTERPKCVIWELCSLAHFPESEVNKWCRTGFYYGFKCEVKSNRTKLFSVYGAKMFRQASEQN